MKNLDFTIDFETCALTANAAPMQVAIVPWRREAESDPFILDDTDEATTEQTSKQLGPLELYVDLRTCVTEGYDFDTKTIQWWAKQTCEAKRAVCEGLPLPIDEVIVKIVNYLLHAVEKPHLESICLWSHGDTDMGILRNLCRRHGYDMEKNVIPHTQLRDCRTVILEAALIEAERSMAGKSTRANGIALPHQVQADPSLAYKLFDPLPDQYAEGREAHDALYDAIRSTWYTWQSLKTLRQ